jgi:hypothetical protein
MICRNLNFKMFKNIWTLNQDAKNDSNLMPKCSKNLLLAKNANNFNIRQKNLSQTSYCLKIKFLNLRSNYTKLNVLIFNSWFCLCGLGLLHIGLKDIWMIVCKACDLKCSKEFWSLVFLAYMMLMELLT